MKTLKPGQRHFIIQFGDGNIHITDHLCDCKFYYNFGMPCAIYVIS